MNHDSTVFPIRPRPKRGSRPAEDTTTPVRDIRHARRVARATEALRTAADLSEGVARLEALVREARAADAGDITGTEVGAADGFEVIG